MNHEMQCDLARRTLALLDRKTTVMAPHVMEEPVRGYQSPEQFEQERKRIFNRYPIFVGLSTELAEPGSWRTLEVAGTPILLTRDQDGRLRALLNVCQHRGVTVARGCGKGARRFTCPFHGWTYDIEGNLVGMPGAEGFAEVRREDRGLIELPAEERYGMMFAAANPEAHFRLEDYLGGLGEHFESFGLASWKSVAAVHEHRIKANWKVVWGTHCETYHFATLHRDSVGPIVHSNTSLADFYGDHALMTSTLRSIDTLRELPEAEWHPVDDGHINLNYRLFPTLSMSVVFGNRLEVFTVFPGDTPHETVALHYAYRQEIPGSEAERTELEEMVRFACQSVVDGEDYRMAELTQRSLYSPSAPQTLVFGRNEPVMQSMALTLRRVLGLGTDPTA
jgi:phenylpropionate dioxygenase-like ring-hydroxylating dioxygenase large terminal subunit